MRVGGQLHAPAALPPGKETRYPLYRRLGRPQGRSGRLRKILPPPGFDPRTVQPVASRYTDRAIPAHNNISVVIIIVVVFSVISFVYAMHLLICADCIIDFCTVKSEGTQTRMMVLLLCKAIQAYNLTFLSSVVSLGALS
jgi:hypothetical protein